MSTPVTRGREKTAAATESSRDKGKGKDAGKEKKDEDWTRVQRRKGGKSKMATTATDGEDRAEVDLTQSENAQLS